VQYLGLWVRIQEAATLRGGDRDSFAWKWHADGRFSSKSAYHMQFQGTVGLLGAPLIWHSFAPLRFKMHAWLALRRRCWTVDRRLRRGLPSHTLCPLCDAEDETLDYLSLHCSFAQGVWCGLVHGLGLPNILPHQGSGINDWWLHASSSFAAADRRKANSLIMLGLRHIWLEWNARVFDRASAPMTTVLNSILDEWRLWLACRGRPRERSPSLV
jgi:hypothetical protein